MMLTVSIKSHGGDIFHFYRYSACEAGKDNKHLYLANIATKGDFDARVGKSSETDDVIGILGQGKYLLTQVEKSHVNTVVRTIIPTVPLFLKNV
jgi:hypothetical protein